MFKSLKTCCLISADNDKSIRLLMEWVAGFNFPRSFVFSTCYFMIYHVGYDENPRKYFHFVSDLLEKELSRFDGRL